MEAACSYQFVIRLQFFIVALCPDLFQKSHKLAPIIQDFAQHCEAQVEAVKEEQSFVVPHQAGPVPLNRSSQMS